MASAPISIKLRCASWQQLASIYKRDLARNAIFLKTGSPPSLGTPVRIDLTLPSESMVVLSGTISKHIGEGELDGRGPGVDVKLNAIPQSAMWLIETALASAQKETGKAAAGNTPAPVIQRASTAPPAAAAQPLPRRAPVPVQEPRDAALGDGSDLAAAETELIVALTSELDSIKKLNPFQVLGVAYQAGEAEVRQAFGDLTKRYHPDRYARFQSREIRGMAAEIFILIRDAYRRLGDATARAAALAQLQGSGRSGHPQPARAPTPAPVPTPPPQPQRPPPTTGETRSMPPRAGTPPPTPVRDGASPIDTVNRPGVMQMPTGALDLDRPADHSLGESMLDTGKYDEALAFFKVLVRKSPNDRNARVGIELAEGMRALSARDRLEAAQRFESALEIDPANERAARELAEMRRLATNERKGMLSRLLGKKE